MLLFPLRLRALCSALLLLAAVPPLCGDVRLLTGDANNAPHNADSFLMDVSADGKFALFTTRVPVSGASPGITQGGLHRRNLATGELVNVGGGVSGGADTSGSSTEAAISDDGQRLAWCSGNKIYWRDAAAGVTRAITPSADNVCRGARLSADGRYLAFVSLARNLVAQTNLLPANGRAAVYLYDSNTQVLSLVSLTSAGAALATGVGTGAGVIADFELSADGRFVFFSTEAANAHPDRASVLNPGYFWLYRRELATGTVVVVNRNAAGQIPGGNFSAPRASADGNRVIFTNVFVTGGPLMVPGYDPVVGSDIYIKDLSAGTVWRGTQPVGGSGAPNGVLGGGYGINDAGTVACLGTSATNLVSENTDPPGNSDSLDFFRVELNAGGAVATTLLTRAQFGSANVGFFSGPYLSNQYIAFNTSYLQSMLGVATDNSLFKHGVALGTFSFSGGNGGSGGAPLVNVSTRARVETGDNVVIAGFVISGSGSKRVLVRTLGPSLAAFGVTGPLADPNIEIKNAAGTTLATNDNWRSNEAAVVASGFAPGSDLESAVVLDLAAGSYTAIVRGNGSAQGVAIVEVYDLDAPGASARLVNLSTRATVGLDQNVMIAGIVVGAGQTKRVLVRSLGPTLANFAVPNVLADPTIELRSGDTLVAENDNWQATQMTDITASGFAPPDAREPGLIVTLGPGSYTAIVRGKNATSGNAIVEIYELP